MGYNFDKNTCDVCGVTQKEAKKYPVDTGINHPVYCKSTSFRLSYSGEVWCARCHREKEIEGVCNLMEAKGGK